MAKKSNSKEIKIDNEGQAVAMLKGMREGMLDVVKALHKWDPDGTCSRSLACAVQDVEMAIENVDGIGIDTPKWVVKLIAGY